MAKAVRVGDTGTAHDGFPPTPITSGSPDVFMDGIPAARVGDPLAPHAKPKHPPHERKIASGSSSVMINYKSAAITGGDISCGGVTIGGGTVNIGDEIPIPVPAFNEHFILLDQTTGQPCTQFAYGIQSRNGLFESRSDKHGKTTLTNSDQIENIRLTYVMQIKPGLR